MKKNINPHLLKFIIFALMLFISLTTINIGSADASSQTVFVVGNWQDYLRMVPLSVGENFTPLLYAEDGTISDNIISFAHRYGGTPIALTESDIDRQIEQRWTETNTIVVAQSQQQLAIYGSVIANALGIPLYIDAITENTLNDLAVQEVVTVGDVNVPDSVHKIHLTNSVEAKAFYETLVEDSSIAVLTTSYDRMSFLAAEIVAYHRGALLFDSSEINLLKPDYLAWVTDPKYITSENVQTLYSVAGYFDTSDIYDAGIGIITGRNAEDSSLLIARAYSYPQFDNSWKQHFVVGSMDSNSSYQESNNNHFSVTDIHGDSLTSKNLEQVLSTASNATIEAHGSPSGLSLADGSWLHAGTSLTVPPLVFAAESCKMRDLTQQNLEDSIALRLVEFGAVAYIGSMEVGGVGLIGEHPFSFSTPDTPLSDLVKLQNAARMSLDADIPRAILIGEPTFHQFDRELVNYELISINENEIKLHVVGQSYETAVSFEVPTDSNIVFAKAYSNNSERLQRYISGGFHFDQPLVSVLTNSQQTVFLEWPGGEGDLILYKTAPATALLRKLLSNGLIGIEGILIDLMTQGGVDWILLAIGIVLFARYRPETRFYQKGRKQLNKGIIIGFSMSLLTLLYCVLLNFSIPWILMAVIGLGAAISTWIPDAQFPASHLNVLKSTIVFLFPLIVTWGIALLLGVSNKVHILIASGLLIVGGVFALITFLSNYLISAIKFIPQESKI